MIRRRTPLLTLTVLTWGLTHLLFYGAACEVQSPTGLRTNLRASVCANPHTERWYFAYAAIALIVYLLGTKVEHPRAPLLAAQIFIVGMGIGPVLVDLAIFTLDPPVLHISPLLDPGLTLAVALPLLLLPWPPWITPEDS